MGYMHMYIWVVSFLGLEIEEYNRVYGRRCLLEHMRIRTREVELAFRNRIRIGDGGGGSVVFI